jgi:hypothetical protein
MAYKSDGKNADIRSRPPPPYNFGDLGFRISAVGNVDNVQGICKATDMTVMN